jgi:hypothetical protein
LSRGNLVAGSPEAKRVHGRQGPYPFLLPP